MKYRVVFESVNGPVMEKRWTLREIGQLLAHKYWPGCACPIWETENGEDYVLMISPALKRLYRRLVESVEYGCPEVE